MAELQPGVIFAGHRIEGIAGRGGFGVVYRATHLVLDHVVALKLISSGRAGDETFRERFKSESRIAVSIRHPNVVAVHHAGEEDGLLFVTMDFIEGTDLRGLLNREGRLTPENAIGLVRQLAAALDAAHEKGLVHRDIKPGNVLIDERGGGQHVYLTDFGLSKQMDATSGVTASGAFVGTLDYVAPEQIRGDRLDARTDVYALGCVMFELLSGDIPFTQEEKVAKIYAHLQEQPPELVDAAPEVPAALSEVVWRAMAKSPDDRHPSAGDFARAAAAAVEGRQPSEPERSVGVGAAAPTQAYDVLAAAAAAATDPELAEGDVPETAESPAPEQPPSAQPSAGAATQAPSAGQPTAAVPPPDVGQPTAAVPPPPPPAAGDETAAVAPPHGRAPERTTQVEAQPKRSRGRAVVISLLVLAAAAGGAYALVGRSGQDKGAGSAGGGGSGGGSAPAVTEIADVAAKPVGIAIAGGDVWVSSRDGGALTRLAASAEKQEGMEIDLGGAGEQVAVGPTGDIWVAVGQGSGNAGYARRYSRDGTQVAEVPVGIEPRGIAVGESYAWVANIESPEAEGVSQIDVATNTVFATRDVGPEPARAASGNEQALGIWVSVSGGDTVARITKFGEVIETIEGVGSEPRGIVTAGSSVWVAAQDSAQLHEIDADENALVESTPICDEPRSVAVGFDSVWITCGGDAVVNRVDIDSGKVSEVTGVGPDPEGVAVDENGVWVTSGGEQESDPGTVFLIDPDDAG